MENSVLPSSKFQPNTHKNSVRKCIRLKHGSSNMTQIATPDETINEYKMTSKFKHHKSSNVERNSPENNKHKSSLYKFFGYKMSKNPKQRHMSFYEK